MEKEVLGSEDIDGLGDRTSIDPSMEVKTAGGLCDGQVTAPIRWQGDRAPRVTHYHSALCESAAGDFTGYIRWFRQTRDMVMKTSTTDKVEGTIKEVKGKIKEQAGKMTGNPDLQDRGTAENLAGKVQKKVGDVKKVLDE